MKRVLVTRPEPGATQTADRLTMLGFTPILAPVSTIIAGQVLNLSSTRISATLLTSRNAVGTCPSSLHHRPVFVVGGATAKTAAKAGFTQIFNADANALELTHLVAERMSPAQGTLLLLSGAGQGGSLATSLRERGFRVQRRVAYRSMPVHDLPASAAEALRHGDLSFALFFSAQTAHRFVRLIKALELADTVNATAAISISEPTAMALRPLPWRHIVVASKPNQDAMLALLP